VAEQPPERPAYQRGLKPWKKGQSGNPDGRPKSKILSDAYKRLLEEPFPNDPQGRTYAELIALGQAREAIKGKTPAAAEIADRTEGRARQAIELSGPDGGAIPFGIDQLDAYMQDILDRGRARARDAVARGEAKLIPSGPSEEAAGGTGGSS
jgi:hypothetical protein